jgi:hypothetical protein
MGFWFMVGLDRSRVFRIDSSGSTMGLGSVVQAEYDGVGRPVLGGLFWFF